LVDFGEFLDIEYDVDGNNEVYPDIYSEFTNNKSNNKKKKGKGKFPMFSDDIIKNKKY